MPKKKNEEIKQNEDPKKTEEQNKEKETNQQLGWVQILLLIGKPLWDSIQKKWRVLSGYQSVLGNTTNQMFFEVTFTDTPYWENFGDKKLYLNIPKDKEENQESGGKGSSKKDKRTKAENEK